MNPYEYDAAALFYAPRPGSVLRQDPHGYDADDAQLAASDGTPHVGWVLDILKVTAISWGLRSG